METVNFQCGNCGKLMAVSLAALGQQVHCPHCRQIVLAPAPNPAVPSPALAAPSASSSMPGPLIETPAAPPPMSEIESIFAPPDANSDALFPDRERALVEMPPAPFELPPAAEPMQQLGPMETTLTYHPTAHTDPGAVAPPDLDRKSVV